MSIASTRQDEIIAASRQCPPRAVIGLNFCPFAKSVQLSAPDSWRVLDVDAPAKPKPWTAP